MKKIFFNISPTQTIVLGFAVIIIIGTMILGLPISTADGTHTEFTTALFTATSAVCVTGLVIKDTGTYWSEFGIIVIAFLIQAGGLGFMSIAIMFIVFIGKKVSLKEKLLMQEALNQNSLIGLVSLTKYVFFGSFIIQFIGAALLSIQFIPDFGFLKGLGYSFFHSISAFCNAGFDITGGKTSLTMYKDNFIVSFTIILLIIIGGIGFTVFKDIVVCRKFHIMSLHSRIVIIITVILLLSGLVLFCFLEWNNSETIGNLSTGGKILASFFQSTTTRTAGFNTIDTDKMTVPSKFLTILFMFIGGSPGSTAGGIKTTTLAVIIILLFSVLKGKDDTEVFKRRLPVSIINRALIITIISVFFVGTVTFLLTITEVSNNFSFLEIFFEVISAFGTVGLSLGITSELSVLGKFIIIITMFAGRVGLLSLLIAITFKQREYKQKFRYPKEKILI